jgi:hypothetical protein
MSARDEAPSGLPDDAEEAPPMGVPADEDQDDDAEGAQMPGIPTEGEPPAAS